jgi:molecular chaperone DnaK (HSP70)
VLRSSAEAALGGGRSVLSAVIGTPVGASEATRSALVAAGKRAGLHRVELIDEAIAGDGHSRSLM